MIGIATGISRGQKWNPEAESYDSIWNFILTQYVQSVYLCVTLRFTQNKIVDLYPTPGKQAWCYVMICAKERQLSIKQNR